MQIIYFFLYFGEKFVKHTYKTIKMNKALFSLILIFSFLIFSCDKKKSFYDDYEECDYSNCISVEPYYADLRISFSRTAENPNPKIYVMRGFFENQNFIDTICTDSLEDYLFYAELFVPLNYNYTLAAEYFVDDDTIWVIDGKYVYKKFYYECDSTCWNTYNTNFNLKLKY